MDDEGSAVERYAIVKESVVDEQKVTFRTEIMRQEKFLYFKM